MDKNAFEKVITGRHLNDIFEFDRLKNVDNYMIHVESINGTDNNYIKSLNGDRIEISSIYVSSDNLRDIKII